MDKPCSNLAAKENLVNLTNLEKCFHEKIGREIGNNVDTVEGMIQNAFLTAFFLLTSS